MRIINPQAIAPQGGSASGAAKLIGQANVTAPFGGRYGNPWLFGAGMSPVTARGYAADQESLARGLGLRMPAGTTITVERESPEVAKLRALQSQVAGSPTAQRTGQSFLSQEIQSLLTNLYGRFFG